MLMILTQCESRASVGRLLTGCLSEEEASAGFKPGRFEYISATFIGTGRCASQLDVAADEAPTSSASTTS